MSGLKTTAAVGGDKKTFSMFVPLAKIDSDQRMVFGYASTDATDMEGETITIDALKAALPGYMKFANLREMHQLSAVGTTEHAEMDDKGLYIGGKIVDDSAWKKVKTKTYKGFSIGGSVTMRDPNNDKIITGIDLIEISLVDRPANPDCLIDMWKAARDGAVRRPVQKWDCGIAGHEHIVKAESVTCIEGQTDKSQLLRTQLIKAVDALDEDGLAAAVGALAKRTAKADEKKDGGDASVETEKPDTAGEHAADTPEPVKDAPVSTKAAKDEEKTPKVGDLIAFANDKHTDKGPSSGKITAVDGNQVKIEHSDAKEDFDWEKLGEPEFKLNDAGDRIWLIKCEVEDVTGQPDSCLITILGKTGEPPVKMITGTWAEKTADQVKAKGKDDGGDDADKSKKADVKADDGKDKPEGDYGTHEDAGYADPGYQEDKKPRYPLKDGGSYSEKRVRAAWNYINKPKNAEKYSSDQVKEIKDKIIAAWKEAIDKDGPPSAEDDNSKAAATKSEKPKMNREVISKLGAPDAKAGFKKGLVAAASAIYMLDGLKDLHTRLAREAAQEGDNSSIPDRVMSVITMFSECCQALLEEEIEEMLANKEIGDLAYPDSCGPGAFYYAQPVIDLAKRAKAPNEQMRDEFIKAIGDRTGEPNFENLTKAVEALFAKGQDEWSGSKPEDQQKTNDSWGSASKPADEQGDGASWPKEVKESVQKVHDEAVKMGATCTGDHAAKKAKDKPAADDGKKDPPAPKDDPEDQADGGKDEGDEGKDPPAKDKADDTKAKGKDDKADKKKAAVASDAEPLTKAEGVALIDTVTAMKSMIEDMASRLGSARNPPPPGGSRQRVDKAQDGPEGLGADGVMKVIDPATATEEERQSVLRAVRNKPRFLGR